MQAWIMNGSRVDAFVTSRGGSITNYAPYPKERVAVAKVTWAHLDLPASYSYNLVVLDPSDQDAMTSVAGIQANGNVSIGWDGRFQALSQDYPFLHPTADQQVADGYTDVTEAISFDPQMNGPLWLVARFARNSAIYVARPGQAPIVAAFLTGPDEKIYWAQKLPVS